MPVTPTALYNPNPNFRVLNFKGVVGYYLEVVPLRRGNNLHYYEYAARIKERLSSEYAETDRTVWSGRGPKRGELKRAAELRLAEFKAYLRTAGHTLPADSRTEHLRYAVRRPEWIPSRLGTKHSPEARAKIAAAIKRRHEEGAYTYEHLHYPKTEKEKLELLKEKARAKGVSLRTYIEQQENRKAELEAYRKIAERIDANRRALKETGMMPVPQLGRPRKDEPPRRLSTQPTVPLPHANPRPNRERVPPLKLVKPEDRPVRPMPKVPPPPGASEELKARLAKIRSRNRTEE